MAYKTVLIGLGGIGLEYDLNIDGVTLTHARALHMHSAYDFVAGVDTNRIQCGVLESVYSVPAYTTIEEAVKVDPDVVVVATPTMNHFSVI